MKKYKAIVLIQLRENVSDAAGNAVRANVTRIADLHNVSRLRLGKCIDIHFEAPDTEHAEKELYNACDLLFANTVIEDWSYEIEEVSV